MTSTGYELSGWRAPLRVWVIVLMTLFGTESLVMAIMPWMLTPQAPRLVESLLDAFLLTSVAAPVLWFFLVRPLQEASRMRARFLSDLFASIEADRRRTAYELHDGVGQSLTLLISGLKSIGSNTESLDWEARCQKLRGFAQQALAEIKRLSLGLRPSLLDDLGLVPAIQRLIEDFRSQNGTEIQFLSDEHLERRMPEVVETTLFRVAQEGLTNIAKHAQATRITLQLKFEEEWIELSIADNGIGIAPELQEGSLPGHLGLSGMRERTALIGGRLTIHSQKGKGTQLNVTLPCEDVSR